MCRLGFTRFHSSRILREKRYWWHFWNVVYQTGGKFRFAYVARRVYGKQERVTSDFIPRARVLSSCPSRFVSDSVPALHSCLARDLRRRACCACRKVPPLVPPLRIRPGRSVGSALCKTDVSARSVLVSGYTSRSTMRERETKYRMASSLMPLLYWFFSFTKWEKVSSVSRIYGWWIERSRELNTRKQMIGRPWKQSCFSPRCFSSPRWSFLHVCLSYTISYIHFFSRTVTSDNPLPCSSVLLVSEDGDIKEDGRRFMSVWSITNMLTIQTKLLCCGVNWGDALVQNLITHFRVLTKNMFFRIKF